MRRDGQLLVGITMVAIFGVFTAMALTYSPDARLAPLIVGAIGLVLSLAQLVANVRSDRGQEKKLSLGRDAAVLIAWFAGFTGATIVVGIVPTALMLVLAFLRFRERERWRTAATVAILFAVVVHVTFEMALGIPLFDGVLRGR